MVGDLVVAREGRVDRGPALEHVGEDAVHDEVAHDDAHRGAHEGVEAAAMPTRTDVAPDRAQGRGPLEKDLPEEEHEHARDVEAVREERAVAGVRALLYLHAADGEDDVLGLAREEVAAARASVREQPDARAHGGARARRSRRVRSKPSSSPSPSRPSGTQGCSRSSREGSPPGSRRSGRRGPAPTRRSDGRRRRPSGPCSARCRRASRAGGPGARARRSRGTRSQGRRSRRARPIDARSAR